MRTPIALVLALAACNGGPLVVVDEEPVACPHLGELAPRLDFGTVAIGDNALPLTVANDCDGPIALGVVASVEGDAAFTLVEDRLGIPAGGADILEIVFHPVDYDAHEATLVLETTDPTQPEATVRLIGRAGPDQDGDGYEAVEMGGRDCDDADPNTFPDHPELHDLADNDCDGSYDEGFVAAGDLFVTEMMVRPQAAPDAEGEWFEIYNASAEPIELRGWHIGPSATSGFVVEASFVLAPGGFAVVGASADMAANGGVPVDVQWPTSAFSLPDDSGTLALVLDGKVLHKIDYTTSWPHEPGASFGLDGSSFTGTKASSERFWCASSSELPSGDRATPGADNDWCGSVDHDVDGVTADDGDCDDTDPDVSPAAPEAWNGADDDCDGQIDDLPLSGADASLVGAAADYLGWSAISTGDLDGDGHDELVIGSHYANSSRGRVYLLEAEDWAGWAAAKAADHDEATFASSSAMYMGELPTRFGDHTGDGDADLLVGGGEYGTGTASWVVLEGPFSGALDETDAVVSGTGTTSYAAGPVAAPDMDGDGVAEVAYGSSYTSSTTSGVVTVHDVSSASGALEAADADLYLTGAGGEYAGSALRAGDLDDDGYDDLVVGSYGYKGAIGGGGGVFVVSGGKSYAATGTLAGAASFALEGTKRNQYLGYSHAVAIADVDGNGDLDLAAGAPYGNTVYVVLDAGSLSGTLDDADADLVLTDSASTWRYFGASVTGGDVDGDGADELLVSTLSGGAELTRLYLFGGVTGGAYTTSDAIATFSATTTSDTIGASHLADLDEDGAAEVMIATPSGATSTGSVWFFSPF